jgi:hypothetical protein
MLYLQRKTRRPASPKGDFHNPRILVLVVLKVFVNFLVLKIFTNFLVLKVFANFLDLEVEIVLRLPRVRKRILWFIGRDRLASQGDVEVLPSLPSAHIHRNRNESTYIRPNSTTPISSVLNTGIGTQSTQSKGAPQLAEVLSAGKHLIGLNDGIASIEE